MQSKHPVTLLCRSTSLTSVEACINAATVTNRTVLLEHVSDERSPPVTQIGETDREAPSFHTARPSKIGRAVFVLSADGYALHVDPISIFVETQFTTSQHTQRHSLID